MAIAPLATQAVPIRALRWAAVFAGMAVGIALQLAFMMAGTALGFVRPDPGTIVERVPMAPAAWNALSMLISSWVGGYVAGRASGLRRAADGMLHGAVASAATTVATAWLATSTAAAAFSGLFGVLTEARPPFSPEASAWLAIAIGIALLAGVAGGLLGARGARRFVHRSLKDPAVPAGASVKPSR